jgi:hypothetical protein
VAIFDEKSIKSFKEIWKLENLTNQRKN